jgi:aspartyl-tRNA(Asn)/glutamyl-tRNA(Gln) amidotransferase subunit C
MKVTDKDVSYVAALANLELTEDERQRMVRDLNSILDYVDRLNRLDTSGVPPMTQVAGGLENSAADEPVSSALRGDELYGLRPSLSQDQALANAPESDGTFFLVPKVIER